LQVGGPRVSAGERRWSGFVGRLARYVPQRDIEAEATEFLGRGLTAAGRGNGYEPERVQTEPGLPESAMPQVRGTEELFQRRVAERRQTRTDDLERLVRGMYVHGLSTQDDVNALFADTFACSRMGNSTVSGVTQQLNQDFETWRRRDLSDADRLPASRLAVSRDGRERGRTLRPRAAGGRTARLAASRCRAVRIRNGALVPGTGLRHSDGRVETVARPSDDRCDAAAAWPAASGDDAKDERGRPSRGPKRRITNAFGFCQEDKDLPTMSHIKLARPRGSCVEQGRRPTREPNGQRRLELRIE